MTNTSKILLVVLVIVLLIPVLIYSTNRINDFAVKQAVKVESDLNNIKFNIPEQSVSGQLHGQAFHIDRAEFSMKNNTLKLREGGDFFSDREVTIKFPGKDIPQGKTYMTKTEKTGTYSKDTLSVGGEPNVNISWKPPGSKFSSTDFLMDNNYDFYLELGHIDGDELEGKIHLQVHDQYKSHARGTFAALITDHEGTLTTINVSKDSFDTLKYLMRNYLTEKFPQDTIEILEFIGGSYTSSGPDEKRHGNMLVLFKGNEGNIQNLRFQFAKNESGWYVANTLRGNQLDQAHPLPPHNPRTSMDHCRYIVAQQIENDVLKNYSKEYIKIINYSGGIGSTKHDRATQKVGFRLGSGQKFNHHYYCEKKGGKWIVAKELVPNEYVDFDTGEIHQRQ